MDFESITSAIPSLRHAARCIIACFIRQRKGRERFFEYMAERVLLKKAPSPHPSCENFFRGQVRQYWISLLYKGIEKSVLNCIDF